MEWYNKICLGLLLFYIWYMGLVGFDTNKRVKHIESEFTLEGSK